LPTRHRAREHYGVKAVFLKLTFYD